MKKLYNLEAQPLKLVGGWTLGPDTRDIELVST